MGNKNIRVAAIRWRIENSEEQQTQKTARAYLLQHVISALNNAQRELEKEGLNLLISDCYRPALPNIKFWTPCHETTNSSSSHHRGTALDIVLVDGEGSYLTMPSFSNDEHALHNEREEVALAHFNKLLKIMHKHGFTNQPGSYHFNWTDAIEHPEKYPVLSHSFPELENAQNRQKQDPADEENGLSCSTQENIS